MKLFNQRPIVIIGDVGYDYVKIFVSHVGKTTDNIKLNENFKVERTDFVISHNSSYSAALLVVSGLKENKDYDLKLFVDSDAIDIKFHTKGKNNNISFLVGSCNLHSLGMLNSPESTFETLELLRKSKNVDFMLHLGDQIYSDIPNPWFTPSLNFYAKKYFDAWSDCKSANTFLRKISNYMTIDDHEIINNYRNRSDRERYETGIACYNIFQRSHSPAEQDNLYYTFERGDHLFFVLDERTTRDNRHCMMICQKQEDALYEWLDKNKNSKGFKFIAGGVPFLVDVNNAEHDKWCSSPFRDQRNKILNHIVNNKIKNVVFLSGDVHCSLVTKSSFRSNDSTDLIQIHEITSSPLNQLQKEKINNFNRHHKIETGCVTGFVNTYKYYDQHSNVALVFVRDNTLFYEYYRTHTGDRVLSGYVNFEE